MIDPMPFIALIDKAYGECWHNACIPSRAWAKMFYAVEPLNQDCLNRKSVEINVGHVAEFTFYRIDQKVITNPDHEDYIPIPQQFIDVHGGAHYRYMIVHQDFCFGVDQAGPSRPVEVTLVGDRDALDKFSMLILLDADSEAMAKSGY